MTDEEFDARIEVIAVDIEVAQAKAILYVAERLAEAYQLYNYRRNEGGCQGMVCGAFYGHRDRVWHFTEQFQALLIAVA
jgi:hypothetical protein